MRDAHTLEPAAFAERIGMPGTRIIDVRTAAEYASGHLAGAMHLDLYAPDFKDKVDTLERDGSYALYCQSGGRSNAARELMVHVGFTAVADLAGGIAAWRNAGGAVVH